MRDIKLALVGIRRRPVAPVIAALSLGLGMSLLTLVFSVVDALFLRPLPFVEQERLVQLSEWELNSQNLYPFITAPHAAGARDIARSFETLGSASRPTTVSLGESGYATRVAAAAVNPGFFDVFRVRPMLGRVFNEADAVASVRPVVISYGAWQTHFGGDQAVVGRPTFVDGARAEVVGVMPPEFKMPPGTRIWLPLGDTQLRLGSAKAGPRSFWIVARLARGVTGETASAELSSILRSIDADLGNAERVQARVISLASSVTAAYRQQIGLWIAAAVVIGLLCAVNFATMILARGMHRRVEIATRLALGASVRSIVGLLTTEAVVLATAGAVISLVFARGLLGVPNMVFDSSMSIAEPKFDWRASVFGFVATVLIGVGFALAPAFQLARADLRSTIAGGGANNESAVGAIRGRRGLVALQLGFSIACVAMLAALVAAFQRQKADGPGYPYDNIVTASLLLRDSTARGIPEESIIAFLREMPGVQSAAVVRSYGYPAARLMPNSATLPAYMNHYDVSPSFFATIGVLPSSGRLPTVAEAAARSPVLIASQTTAKWMSGWWPDGPVNQRVALSLSGSSTRVWHTVTGTIRDVRFAPDFETLSAANFTVQSLPMARTSTTVLLRSNQDPATQLRQLRTRLSSFDARIVFVDVTTVAAQVNAWLAPARARVLFFTLVALLAVALAVIGVYGLTSYAAEVRSYELSVRMALGASTSNVILVLLKELGAVALLAVVGGLIVGTRGVYLVNVTLGNSMIGTPVLSFPVIPIATSVVALLVVSVLGTFVPIRRLLNQDIARIIQGN